MNQELELKSNCSKCGTARRQNNRFCTKCGADLLRTSGTSPSKPSAANTSPNLQAAELANPLASLSDTVSRIFDRLMGKPLPDDQKAAPGRASPVGAAQTTPTVNSVNAPTVALSQTPETPVLKRALHQSAGTATDKGRMRDHNEDFVAKMEVSFDQSGTAEPIGLYIVADGMGGHAAGEKASEASVKRTFLRFIENNILPDLRERQTRRLDAGDEMNSEQSMKALVQEANRLVYQGSRAGGSGRGTTITAALVIGNRGTIANVGDSRTYLLRGGQLQLITQDHSLVYSLYKAGQITKDDIYTHPQKNEIYRSLGDKEKVEVDTFSVTLQAGDLLLLCSDGLWEMVRDPAIMQIMVSSSSHQNACDRLIAAANNNGGEDNISVIIVALE